MTDDLAAMAAFAEARLATEEEFLRVARKLEANTRQRLGREIESTRMLLAEIQAMPHDYVDGDIWCPAGHEPPSGPCRCGSDDRKQRMLAAIAMRWADYPDYLSSWAPAAVGG